jgi:O-antigen ligase
MPVRLQNERRSLLFFAALLIMLVSAFISRAVLSVSVILFVAVSIYHRELKRQWRIFIQSPVLWSISLLFLVPFISGLWSEDKETWVKALQVKIPLLVLPFAFAFPFAMKRERWHLLAISAITLLTVLSVWSFINYLGHSDLVHESYLRGKALVTPFGNDRVRFSWAISLAIPGVLWFAWKNQANRGRVVVFLLLACWLTFYLHILAVRTGLFTFYVLLLFILAGLLRRKVRLAGLLFLFIVAMPVAAYFIFPTFQNRVKYIRHELDFALNGSYKPGSTDPVRLLSIQSGLSQLPSSPLSGSGFGDVAAASEQWYEAHFPQMLPSDRILPSSEFIMYGAGAGVPGLLVFCFAMALPFFVKFKYLNFFIPVQVAIVLSFLFDIGLEVQYGVFLFCFTLLCSWKWLLDENSQSLQE